MIVYVLGSSAVSCFCDLNSVVRFIQATTKLTICSTVLNLLDLLVRNFFGSERRRRSTFLVNI